MALEEMQLKNMLLLACLIPSVLPITISKWLPLGRHPGLAMHWLEGCALEGPARMPANCVHSMYGTAHLTEVRAHFIGWGKQNWCITMMHEAIVAESHAQRHSFLPSLTVSLETREECYTSDGFLRSVIPPTPLHRCGSEISRVINVGNNSRPLKQVSHCPNTVLPPDTISPSYKNQGNKDQHWGKIPYYLNVKTFYWKSECCTSRPISHTQWNSFFEAQRSHPYSAQGRKS